MVNLAKECTSLNRIYGKYGYRGGEQIAKGLSCQTEDLFCKKNRKLKGMERVGAGNIIISHVP